jgi:hypothetical protein
MPRAADVFFTRAFAITPDPMSGPDIINAKLQAHRRGALVPITAIALPR